MRAYIAIRLSQGSVSTLQSAQKELESAAPGVFSWSNVLSAHLTLYFLGEIDESGISEVAARLKLLAFQPFRLGWGGLVILPEPTVPKILASGVIGDVEELRKLQRKVHDVVFSVAGHQETRAFFPHVTFGRLKKGVPPSAKIVKRALTDFVLKPSAIEQVCEIGIYSSEGKDEQGSHEKLASISLGEIS